MTYEPSKEILDKYADVMVNYALNGGKGIKKGEVVLLQVPECAKPMLLSLRRILIKAGANVIVQYLPDGIARETYELASDEQLSFFPDKYLRGVVDQINHRLVVIADVDKFELKGIDSKKLMIRQKAFKPYMRWLEEKENTGKYSWTLCLYGTPAMAKDVGMSIEEYWREIIKACYLEDEDPVKTWKNIQSEIERVKTELDSLEIQKVHIESEGTDLWIGLGDNRKWLGGTGRNIPSFEVFISPDFRKTNGHIFLNEPIYSNGNLIKNIRLVFDEGRIIKCFAEEGEGLLKEILSTKGADFIGEFSLTDNRLSRITKFMGTTLYDENVGGGEGNTHIAIGNAYKESYTGDRRKVKREDWKKLGFNESVIHIDLISTLKRKVTAILKNGEKKLIYENGRFVI